MQTGSPLCLFGNREIAWHFSNRARFLDVCHLPLFQAYTNAAVLDMQNCCLLPFIVDGYRFFIRGRKRWIFKKSDFLGWGSHHVDLWAAVLLQPPRDTRICVKNSPWVKSLTDSCLMCKTEAFEDSGKKIYNDEALSAEKESALHLTVAVLPSAGGSWSLCASVTERAPSCLSAWECSSPTPPTITSVYTSKAPGVSSTPIWETWGPLPTTHPQ